MGTEKNNQIFEEWKYRHELFWRSLFLYAAAFVAISSVPYLKPDLGKILGNILYLFPALAMLMAIVGLTHLYVEHARLIWLRTKSDLISEAERKEFIQNNNNIWVKPLKWKMGAKIFVSIFALLIITSIFNFIVVWKILSYYCLTTG